MNKPWVARMLGLFFVIAVGAGMFLYMERSAAHRALTDARIEITRLSDALQLVENAKAVIQQQLEGRHLLSEQERIKMAQMSNEMKKFQTGLDTLQAENNELKNQLELSGTQNGDLQERLAVRSNQVNELRTNLSDCGNAAQDIENRLFEVTQQIDKFRTETNRLMEQNDIFESNLNQLRNENARRMTEAQTQFSNIQNQLFECSREVELAAGRVVALEERAAELDSRSESAKSALDRSESENEIIAARNQTLEKLLEESNASVEMLNEQLAQLDEETGATTVALARLEHTYDELRKEFQAETATKETTINRLKERLSVTLLGDVLFDFGRASITARGTETLGRVGEILHKNEMVEIVVAGHTDDVPIAEKYRRRFPSNWELSSARAAAVVRFFQNRFGIAPSRMIVQGFSYHQPAAPNNSPENRAMNRRVEIFIKAKH